MSAGAAQANRWWITPRPRPAATWRLICFPHAGGDAAVYHPWAAALPAHIELVAVRLPGRGARLREPAFNRLEPLVAALKPALAPLGDRRLALFGHSLGALVAYELARGWLADGGPQVEHLFVSGAGSPQRPPPIGRLHERPDAELLDYLRTMGGTPPELLANAELMAMMVPILRADFAVRDTYEFGPGPTLACPITALGGAADTHLSAADLQAWQTLTTGPFAMRQWPGGHFYLQREQAAVLQTIADALPA